MNGFPSAASGAGFKPIADYVHRQGLKFGIPIMRGIPRQADRASSYVPELLRLDDGRAPVGRADTTPRPVLRPVRAAG